jgi:hypothetical protein
MKVISEASCKAILVEAFAHFPSMNVQPERLIDIDKLATSDFNVLATYIDETIGVSVTGKSIKKLLNGAGSKNPTINILCAFLLVKDGAIKAAELNFKEHASDNRYFVRRYSEQALERKKQEHATEDQVMPVQNHQVAESSIKDKPVNKLGFNKTYLFVILGLLLIVMVSLSIYNSSKEEMLFPEMHVSVEDNSDRFPKEIIVSYDLKSEQFLRNSRISFMDTPVLLSELKGVVSLTAPIPNLYWVSFYANKVAYDKKRVLLTSNGWQGYIGNTTPLVLEDYTSEGVIHLHNKSIVREPSKDYYTTFNIFRNFGIDGDNFTLEADIKNPPNEGSSWAYDISVDVIGFENPITFNFLSPDAITYANMIVGDTDFKVGKKREVLKKMGILFPDWQHLTVTCKNKEISIILNDRIIIAEHYEGKIGQVVGLQFLFKGSGYVKNVELNGMQVN